MENKLLKIDWDDYPDILTEEHIEKLLGVSKSSVYRFLKKSPFPVLRIGKLIRVYKEIFYNWLMNELHSVEVIKEDKDGKATKINYLGNEYTLLVSKG